MNIERLPYLLARHQEGLLDSSEWEELKDLMERHDLMQLIAEDLDKTYPLSASLKWDKVSIEEAWQKIDAARKNDTSSTHRVYFLRRGFLRIAAVIILALGAGAYLWHQNSRKQAVTDTSKQPSMDIAPGKEGAILTLADGSQIVLDSIGNGLIASQKGANVLLENGQLAYNSTGENTGELAYNTMTTPKGRQFQVVLPDGTKAWLNAASSLKFPTRFSGKERRVSITGEVYFEVARQAKQPFFVKINDQAEIQVLGTSFNANAYENEAGINTTLLEGSVKIIPTLNSKNPTSNVILKPGQQARLINHQLSIVKNVDIEKVTAWKNGLFNFKGATLEDVMRQLERWYDIEVVYEKGIPNIHFGGEISRDVSLAGVIRGLEDAGVRFRIEEGRKLVVMP